MNEEKNIHIPLPYERPEGCPPGSYWVEPTPRVCYTTDDPWSPYKKKKYFEDDSRIFPWIKPCKTIDDIENKWFPWFDWNKRIAEKKKVIFPGPDFVGPLSFPGMNLYN